MLSSRGSSRDPQGIKLTSLVSPALAGGFFTTGATWEAPHLNRKPVYWCLQLPPIPASLLFSGTSPM